MKTLTITHAAALDNLLEWLDGNAEVCIDDDEPTDEHDEIFDLLDGKTAPLAINVPDHVVPLLTAAIENVTEYPLDGINRIHATRAAAIAANEHPDRLDECVWPDEIVLT